MREEVQRVGVMQRLLKQVWAVVQSVEVLHSTQRPRAVLQTREWALHSRSEVQRILGVVDASKVISVEASVEVGGEFVEQAKRNNTQIAPKNLRPTRSRGLFGVRG